MAPSRIVLFAGLVAAPIGAQDASDRSPIDVAAVAAFADGFFPVEMAKRHIPGLVFVLVANGHPAVVRGFGAAQLDPWRPVDPTRTVFRLASVSKTITATAAMRLVQDGRLDLHADINTYLRPFKVPATRRPITLHDLLTHTAGFDERLTSMAARRAKDLQPLDRYLPREMPPRFIEAGRVVSYSNYGFGLVGWLVQEASGQAFEDYVRQAIFDPLGMDHSGLLGEAPPENLAVAYDYIGGQYRPLTADYVEATPAGGFFTTGADMARFLIAHLRGGAYDGRRILADTTMALMHAEHFAQEPGLSGWAYGLWEDARDGDRALLHNGGGKGYRALLYLVPAHDVGFFVAYNLADRHPDGELQEVFTERFRRLFLAPESTGRTAIATAISPDSLIGEYWYVRRARTTAETFISVPNRAWIRKTSDGALIMSGVGEKGVRLEPSSRFAFRLSDGRGRVAFGAFRDGKARRLSVILGSGFPAVYERVSWFGEVRVQAVVLVVMIVVFLYTVVRWVTVEVRRRLEPARLQTRLAGLASALNLTFLIAFPLAFVGRLEGGIPEFVYGIPRLTNALACIPLTTMVMGGAVLTAPLWNGTATRRPRFGQLESVMAGAALVAFACFAAYWHVLGPET